MSKLNLKVNILLYYKDFFELFWSSAEVTLSFEKSSRLLLSGCKLFKDTLSEWNWDNRVYEITARSNSKNLIYKTYSWICRSLVTST